MRAISETTTTISIRVNPPLFQPADFLEIIGIFGPPVLYVETMMIIAATGMNKLFSDDHTQNAGLTQVPSF
jgi:hypothetical protein